MNNQEIIKQLAEKVFPDDKYFIHNNDGVFYNVEHISGYARTWNPLENIADAFMLYDKITKEDNYICIESDGYGFNYCQIDMIDDEGCKMGHFTSSKQSSVPRSISVAVAKAYEIIK